MSGEFTSADAWSTRLDPVVPLRPSPPRADDLRLGDYVEFWSGGPSPLRPGRPVLIGFPQDAGVRRNAGRPGAAGAPLAIRRWLYRLTPWDAITGADLTRINLLDLGNVRSGDDVEASQAALAAVVAAVRTAGGLPVVLGGGHETAYGCFLGHVAVAPAVAIVNIDAHLDVRPTLDGRGHSGSSFRQALEHPTHPLTPGCYVCLGRSRTPSAGNISITPRSVAASSTGCRRSVADSPPSSPPSANVWRPSRVPFTSLWTPTPWTRLRFPASAPPTSAGWPVPRCWIACRLPGRRPAWSDSTSWRSIRLSMRTTAAPAGPPSPSGDSWSDGRTVPAFERLFTPTKVSSLAAAPPGERPA